jgi:CRP/FNR family transcriptional regulator, cyclic AMP receptor protein
LASATPTRSVRVKRREGHVEGATDRLRDRHWPTGSLLAELSDHDREALLGLGTLRQYTPGMALLAEGDKSTHLFLLIDGCVKVTATNEDGHVALLAIRVGGDLVGELSSLDGNPRSATVTVAGSLVSRRISQQEFHAFLRDHPIAALAVSSSIARKLRSATRRWVDFNGRDVRARLARVLVELARSYGRPAVGGVEIGISLTQPELAGLIGAGEPTVHKALADLRRRGVMSVGYRKMIIKEPSALAAIAGLDAAKPVT